MTPQQAQTAQGIVNEQLGRQARGVPEHFGRMPLHPDASRANFVIPPTIDQGLGQNYQGSEGVGVFSRADKWLGQPPGPSVEKWTSRELEIAGFADYVVSLQSWAALGSMTFSEEISVSLRWPDTIWQQTLTNVQKVRSVRLYGILRAAFAEHARASLMIQAFSEGLTLDGNPVQDPGRLLGNTTCGFELLRQLAQQFSLRSRAEALSMRSELLQRIFALKNSEASQATMVGDVIRKIDIEVARYWKLLGTLPSHLDRQGLSIGDGDMLVILLRSLPEEAKKYVLHHSPSDTYSVARTAALKFEQQQRLFLDLNFGSRKTMSELFDLTHSDEDGAWDTAWYHDATEHSISAVSGDRCEKCGKKHRTQVSGSGEEESWSWEETWQDEAWGAQDWGEAWADQDWQGETSEQQQQQSESKPDKLQLSALMLSPLFVSSLHNDAEYWLLDSGASVTVWTVEPPAVANNSEGKAVEVPNLGGGISLEDNYPDYESAAEHAGLTMGLTDAMTVEQEMDLIGFIPFSVGVNRRYRDAGIDYDDGLLERFERLGCAGLTAEELSDEYRFQLSAPPEVETGGGYNHPGEIPSGSATVRRASVRRRKGKAICVDFEARIYHSGNNDCGNGLTRFVACKLCQARVGEHILQIYKFGCFHAQSCHMLVERPQSISCAPCRHCVEALKEEFGNQ
ncbi:unnamed protein product [Symbiodinium sp. CCMP2592]|nr:unnamed protein product [Symbiodinium sp. CCMP2592]